MAQNGLDITHTILSHIKSKGMLCPHCNYLFDLSSIVSCCPRCLIEYEFYVGREIGYIFKYNDSGRMGIMYKMTLVNWSHR